MDIDGTVYDEVWGRFSDKIHDKVRDCIFTQVSYNISQQIYAYVRVQASNVIESVVADKVSESVMVKLNNRFEN